jgi:predicted GNAT family N-acyltransferase
MTVAVRIELGGWTAVRSSAEPVRRKVFVEEQGVPEDLEIDESDAASLHALALDADGTALGTGRLLPDGHIGRMAVLKPARGRGIGAALLLALVDAARARGEREVVLSAQTQAIAFYERFGFVVEGDEFNDAGIAHRLMRRRL